jgi:hypothetical protein
VCVMRWWYYAVAAAACTTALSFAPSRRPPALITTTPSKDPKMPSHHYPQASRASFLSDCLCLFAFATWLLKAGVEKAVGLSGATSMLRDAARAQ